MKTTETEKKEIKMNNSRKKEYKGVFVVGNIIISQGGKKYKIIKGYYDNPKNIFVDVETESGEIWEHRKPGSIKQRTERTPQDINSQRVQDVIGQKGLTSSLEDCEIIGGTNLSDLIIRCANGTLVEHVKYHDFVKGKVTKKDFRDTIISRKKYEYLNKTVLQNCGLEATCIDYIDSKHIVVRFSNGIEKITNTSKFNRGLVSIKTCGNVSFNEFVVQYCLRDAGFIKMPQGSLSHIKDFGKREFDIYHPKYKIAVEYDGYWHKNKKVYEKDLIKNKLCEDAGIIVFRLRENNLPKINDNISKNIIVEDCHYFCECFINAIQQLVEQLNDMINDNINIPDLRNNDVRDDIRREYFSLVNVTSRINEVRYNKYGEKMRIFDYLDCSNVGVEFDNGYRTYTSYHKFKTGRVICLYCHYGEINENRIGLKMKIISTHYGNIVDVQFEDGTIVKNQPYCYFETGQITNPNYNYFQSECREDMDKKHIGEIVEAKCGLMAEIIDVIRKRYMAKKSKQSTLMVIARFEDGEVSKPTEYQHFLRGYIKHPTIRVMPKIWHENQKSRNEKIKKNNKDRLLGQLFKSADGYEFTVINYFDSNHIRIKFSDGFELNTSVGILNANKVLRFSTRNNKRNTIPFEEWVKNLNKNRTVS